MNQEWFKDVLMITKMITKDDDKKLKGQSKDEFKMFKKGWRTLQDSRGKLNSRIKIQGSSSKNQDQDSRFKVQELKRRLNQDKYEKVFSKTE